MSQHAEGFINHLISCHQELRPLREGITIQGRADLLGKNAESVKLLSHVGPSSMPFRSLACFCWNFLLKE
jgi:hypothetical protein